MLEYAKLYVVIRLYVGRVQLLVLSNPTLEGIPSLDLTYLPQISSCNTGNYGRSPVLSMLASHAHKRKPFKFLGISLCITFNLRMRMYTMSERPTLVGSLVSRLSREPVNEATLAGLHCGSVCVYMLVCLWPYTVLKILLSYLCVFKFG